MFYIIIHMIDYIYVLYLYYEGKQWWAGVRERERETPRKTSDQLPFDRSAPVTCYMMHRVAGCMIYHLTGYMLPHTSCWRVLCNRMLQLAEIVNIVYHYNVLGATRCYATEGSVARGGTRSRSTARHKAYQGNGVGDTIQ